MYISAAQSEISKNNEGKKKSPTVCISLMLYITAEDTHDIYGYIST